MRLKHLALFLLFFITPLCFAGEYIIYSVVQDFPMGEPNEILKKNYYVNIGKKQGVKTGAKLDVYRVISRTDPYTTKKRYTHKVKIGQLQVLHSEDDNAITKLATFEDTVQSPLFEINSFMVGDKVAVHINN